MGYGKKGGDFIRMLYLFPNDLIIYVNINYILCIYDNLYTVCINTRDAIQAHHSTKPLSWMASDIENSDYSFQVCIVIRRYQ